VLHKCANPDCPSPFRKLSEGKLFLLETGALGPASTGRGAKGRSVRQIEHYWLCDQCASVLTLSFEKDRGMVTVPLPRVAARITVSSVRLPDLPDRAGARDDQTLSKSA